MNQNKTDKRKETHKILRQKNEIKAGTNKIAYNNNEAKKFYQEAKSIGKGFKPQTSLIRDKQGNVVSSK
jgi:hypothetical protein